MRKIKLIWTKTAEIEEEIKCPYCGCMFSDSWEDCPDEDSIEKIECDCGKIFEARKCTMIDYRTSQNCDLNNEEHKWIKHSPISGIDKFYECEKCGAMGRNNGKNPKTNRA